MKKEIKKLSLGKRTISNLSSPEMARHLGGGPTKRGNTCAEHNTCTCTCNTFTCFLCTHYCSDTCGAVCGGNQ